MSDKFLSGDSIRIKALCTLGLNPIEEDKSDKFYKDVELTGKPSSVRISKIQNLNKAFSLYNPKITESLIKSGFPATVAEPIKQHMDLTDEQLSTALGISPKTLQRKRTSKGTFSAVESDRLYRYARIFALASEVLESEESARRWLNKPKKSLGGRVPLDMLETEEGARQVENQLFRIEHSILL